MKYWIALGALLACGACRHRQGRPPVPPAPAARPQARTPRPAARPVAAPPQVEAPAVRAPQDLQSRTDAVGDRAAIEARLREVRTQLDTLQRRTLPPAAAQDRTRAAGMLDLAQQALNRGNLRQAEELSTRAASLTRTLTDAR